MNSHTDTALILGSGLGSIVERLETEQVLGFEEIPGIPAPRVPGHSGRVHWGRLFGKPMIIVQGRAHLYEGRSASEVTAMVRYLAGHGVRRLLLTNAAGTLNPAFRPGSWMLIQDHLNLTGHSPLVGGPNFHDMSEVYSSALRGHFIQAAQAAGVGLNSGVYAGVLGPQYETPAEIRMLRTLGADAVGMSTVLEAVQARALGLEVAGFSCLTNWAAGLGEKPLSHAEVLQTGIFAAAEFLRVMEAAVSAKG